MASTMASTTSGKARALVGSPLPEIAMSAMRRTPSGTRRCIKSPSLSSRRKPLSSARSCGTSIFGAFAAAEIGHLAIHTAPVALVVRVEVDPDRHPTRPARDHRVDVLQPGRVAAVIGNLQSDGLGLGLGHGLAACPQRRRSIICRRMGYTGILMERKRLNSSKIRAVGYDPGKQILEVEFSNGTVYAYSGVSPEVHRRLMNAPSPGQFFRGAHRRGLFLPARVAHPESAADHSRIFSASGMRALRGLVEGSTQMAYGISANSGPPSFFRCFAVEADSPQARRQGYQARKIVEPRVLDSFIAAALAFAGRHHVPDRDAQALHRAHALGVRHAGRRQSRLRRNDFPEMILRVRVIFACRQRGHRRKAAEDQGLGPGIDQGRQASLSHRITCRGFPASARSGA